MHEAMSTRLKTEVWAKAYIRRCTGENIAAVIVRRGDNTAGTVLLKINRLDGTCAVLAPTVGDDGTRAWFVATKDFVTEETADAYVARQLKFDPDLWVIEVEDRQGRNWLTEPVRV